MSFISNHNIVSIEDFGVVYSVYLAHANDDKIRFLSSSGGFCKSFLSYLLDKKIVDAAIVTRTGDPSSPLKAETIITNSREEILTPRTNSIYAPTNPLGVIRDLNPKKRYAIVGLGCHIRELSEMQERGKLSNILIKIGLLCHHTPKLSFTEEVLKKAGIPVEDVFQIQYRGNGWPGGLTILTRSGAKKFIPTDDYWSNDLSNGLAYCSRCSEICDNADVVACDPWNLGLEEKEKNGMTLIFCRSKNLDDLVNQSREGGAITLYKCDKSVLVQSQRKHILDKKSRRNT